MQKIFYMNIKTLISSIISGLGSPAPTFIYGTKSWQNLVADNSVLPVVFLDEPVKSNDTIKAGGYIEESYPLTFLFLDKTEMDYIPAQHDTVINSMRILRREFIIALENNENTQGLRNIITTDVMNIFDCNLSGVLLQLTYVPYNLTDSVC